MDIVCKLFPMEVDSSSLDFSVNEKAGLRHAMVYLDAKGLKDCLHSPSLLGSLHPNLVPIQESLENMLPSLRIVSKGLCRVDDQRIRDGFNVVSWWFDEACPSHAIGVEEGYQALPMS